MFEPGIQMLDFVHLALMLGACIFCYMSGKLSGAKNLANALLHYKILKVRDFQRLEKKLLEDDS